MSDRQPTADSILHETQPSSAGEEAPRPQPAAKPPIERWLEVAEALVMGVVAVATAWGGYQAARWSGLQSMRYSEASAIRVDATRDATHAGQQTLYDVVLFNQWLNARLSGQTQLAGIYERRFRPEFRPAFQAWLATDPFRNSQAPAGPLFMPQYRVADADRASQLETEASKAFDEGKAANQQSDNYVLNAVFLASTLFFIAIGQRFDWIAVRAAVLVGAFGMLVYGLYHLMTYPVL
jgi:hypothetical protein